MIQNLYAYESLQKKTKAAAKLYLDQNRVGNSKKSCSCYTLGIWNSKMKCQRADTQILASVISNVAPHDVKLIIPPLLQMMILYWKTCLNTHKISSEQKWGRLAISILSKLWKADGSTIGPPPVPTLDAILALGLLSILSCTGTVVYTSPEQLCK